MIVIGVDPGLTGAVAFIDSVTRAVSIVDVPTRDSGSSGMFKHRVDGRMLAHAMREHVPLEAPVTVFCEAMQVMGKGSQFSAGALMRAYGAIESVLDMLRWDVRRVQPRAWKESFNLLRQKNETDAAFKARSREMALRLYPDAARFIGLAKHHNRAEALLLAHYGMGVLA